MYFLTEIHFVGQWTTSVNGKCVLKKLSLYEGDIVERGPMYYENSHNMDAIFDVIWSLTAWHCINGNQDLSQNLLQANTE